jgi:hypothetical protein
MSFLKRGTKLDLSKTGPTGISLEKRIETAHKVILTKGLGEQKAAVYLVIDRSGSMEMSPTFFYTDHTVQNLAEQVLGLAAQFDDDGKVPVVYFDTKVQKAAEIEIGQHAGVIDKHHKKMGRMGGTDYSVAMDWVVDDYRKNYPAYDVPAFVIFQTDGQTSRQQHVENTLCLAAELPIFWQFVGFGPEGDEDGYDVFAFLKSLNSGLPVPARRKVDNAGFFALGANPKDMADETLYGKLMEEFPSYLNDARIAGVLKG